MRDEEKTKIEKMILDVLQQHPYGLTISEMSRILKINRVTLSKYLDVLREKGLIDYRAVGRAKVWFINEDITILEAIFGDKDLPRLLRLSDQGFYEIGDVKFLILPTEFIQDLYLIIGRKLGLKTIRELGKRLGEHIANTYKMYSGIEKLYKEETLSYLIDFIEKLGLGKIEEKFIDIRTSDIIITFSNTLEEEELENLKGIIRELREKPKCYFLEGLFEGLLSGLLGIEIEAIETKCKLKGDPYNEFVIRRKK